MSFEHTSAGDAVGTSSGPSVLCRIVDKPDEKESDAVGWLQQMFALWSMAVLSVLVVLWS